MEISITSLAYSLPPEKITGAELSARFGGAAMRKIEAVSGILERRRAGAGVCASDLAAGAARLLFSGAGYSPKDFDLLIFASQTPDYLIPTTACILQDRLGMDNSCAAFDLNLGCSQFVYALATARAWIEGGLAGKALVLCADTPQKILDPSDRATVCVFGDGAAACAVSKTEAAAFSDFSFGTDGSGYDGIIWPNSAMRKSGGGAVGQMAMDGFKIFAFAYRRAAESVSGILKKNGMSVSDIDLFVFHQAGEMIVKSCAERLKIPPEKVYYKMHDIGNCGGSSVPIALADAAISGRLKTGMKVLVCAFGVGLSWGSAILEWGAEFRGAFSDADFSKSPAKPQSQRAADSARR